MFLRPIIYFHLMLIVWHYHDLLCHSSQFKITIMLFDFINLVPNFWIYSFLCNFTCFPFSFFRISLFQSCLLLLVYFVYQFFNSGLSFNVCIFFPSRFSWSNLNDYSEWRYDYIITFLFTDVDLVSSFTHNANVTLLFRRE